MKLNNSSSLPQELEQARQQLEAWRSTHRPRCHIPYSLWKRAAELASQHGLYLTSRTLRVDYMRLKKLVQPASPEQKNAELEGAGRRMRIQMKGMRMAELVGLSRMVWADKS